MKDLKILDEAWDMNPVLEIGRITKPHGVRGEVKVDPWCDSPEMFLSFKTLYWKDGMKRTFIESARMNKDFPILKLSDIDDANTARKAVGKILMIERSQLDCPDDGYFIADTIGNRVYDADTGEDYGVIVDLTMTGSHFVYHVRFPDGKIRFVPGGSPMIKKVDIKNKTIGIAPVEGLFDD